MTKQIMPVMISCEPAAPCWGEGALLSSSDKGMTIHLKHAGKLCAVQSAGRKLDGQGIRNVALAGEGWDLEKSWAFWQGFRAPKGARTIEWPVLPEADRKELENRIRTIDWVRDVINAPAEELGPEQLAQRAIDLLCTVGAQDISYRIIKGDDLLEQGYTGIHTVGRGSSRPPVFLALDYNPGANPNAPVFAALVGKGITFDSGGYSIKPSSSMNSMKADMGGAATLAGSLALAISRGLQKRVKMFLCIADNMVSGNAFKLGDIIRYRNGKSVEIMNTDAEGRLVLADGLIDASKEKPTLIIDAATLTGAAKMAVGNDYHSVLSFDDKLVADLMNASDAEFELFWRLPLAEFHRQQLPSGFADLNNIAAPSHTAGASTAAAFLSHFVENYRQNWVHIDCSATYRKSAVSLWAEGATGTGVRTLANLLISKSK
ncbi:aminopeptidase PepB [Providencia huaxiensis]|uniref:Aminopeptidase PepB n=1 Tax=Providencia huaxiensis TaxID=2027290 RepID=A0A8I2AKA1_9GAMM|nr:MULTISPECIES: aminopeptidase PepB [Providencia]MBN6362050.1 aminopeptidase PepB [Providencia huaxiensis]MBQ0266898.1 aminopeptidase PepB [Providencia huaxiensis]MBQ0535093.1 aminopeptidase PepB [Providencia huaxiensis]MBQ0589769.1 aminopeptidase PepB [Providencia huaxiensis]MCD2529660.1 aminopeptidase PepB [Providencia huaxiensis]